MKKIKIKGFCKMSLLCKVLFLVLLSIGMFFTILGICEGISALGVAGGIILFAFAMGMGCYFNYGITISDKRVTVFYIYAVKVFDYEDISRVSITAYEDGIACEIKAKDTPLYEIYLDEFEISSKSSVFSDVFAFKVKVKITNKMIEKWTKNLSNYKNVHVTVKLKNH